MSKRLQVVLSDAEMVEIQRLARSKGIPVGEWVRQVLRDARARAPRVDPQTKLGAVRAAARHSFPTADVPLMLQEIERGYHE